MIANLIEFLCEKELQAAISIYGAITGTASHVGAIRASRDMGSLRKELEGLNVKITQISDHIFAAPNSVVVNRASAAGGSENSPKLDVSGPEVVKGALESLGEAAQADLLTSAVIWTPERFHQALKRNPSDLLLDIRGFHENVAPPQDKGMVPVLFEGPDGVKYVGWQKRVILETVFNLKVDISQWKSVTPIAKDSSTAPRSPEGQRDRGGLQTNCPACGTAFWVRVEQLRIADGWVRCGNCSEVFDATERLRTN